MTIFLLWTGVALLIISSITLLLWYQAKKRSKFQARLTLLFLAFVFIPIIPLLLFAGYLLTKSTEMLILPNLEVALDQSLNVIRLHLEEKGKNFFQSFPVLKNIDQQQLLAANVAYAGQINYKNNKLFVADFISSDNDFSRNNYSPAVALDLVKTGSKTDALIRKGDFYVYEFFSLINDTTISLVGIRVPENIISAEKEISSALKNYASLSLLHNTFVERGLIWAITFFIIVILASLAAYAARLLSHGISGPIQALADGMRTVGSGNLQYQLTIKAKDEIAFLVQSFNDMTNELASSREKLQRMERVAAWRDVARQISHEIKNTLTPIQLSLNRLLRSLPPEYMSSKDLTESFRIINEEIGSMQRMANEFSQFARMPELKIETADICEIIRDSLSLFKNEHTSVSFTFESDQDSHLIPIDREQMRRAIHNLIKNAVEASPSNGCIEIEVQRKNKKIEIQIRDFGQGMTDDEMKRIFEPYFTTKMSGTGIGLFIVNRIIAEHNGRISVASKKGQGTTFCLELMADLPSSE